MTKALFKKQMMELFSFFWQNKKKNRNRKGAALVMGIVLYVAIFGGMTVLFYFMAGGLCRSLVMAELDWLYFLLTGLIGTALGAFGSIFNTYAGLYQAKDNAFLLSMPIPVTKLLTVRLSGVYVMGLFYQLLVMIPVLIRYILVAGPGFWKILSAILTIFLQSVFVLILSAVLGFAVAKIGSATKRKSLVTVVITLAFLVGYYFIYGMAAQYLQKIISHPQEAGERFHNRFSPLYHMGMAATGNPVSLLLVTIVTVGLFCIVYAVLAGSYKKIVTSEKGEAKVQYREQQVTVRSSAQALLAKEFRRFLASPTYMLNCGLGVILMIVAGVALLIKADTVLNMMEAMFSGNKDVISLAAAAVIGVFASMNDITAPSVSLEGKQIWMVQSFPVSAFSVLKAKIKLHLLLTFPPAAVLTVCIEVVLRPELQFAILIPVVVALFIVLMALIGLFLNLKFPNLKWTNEVIPVKQSASVMLSLFGGWVIIVALSGLYLLLSGIINPAVFLVLTGILLTVLSLLLYRWIMTKGAKIFETL